MSPIHHARHHVRFYTALLVGVLTWLVAERFDAELAPLLGGDLFFATYLVLMMHFVAGASVEHLRERADAEDEGLPLIIGLTIAGVGFCVASIFTLLGTKPSLSHLLISLVAVPLGWLMLHSVLAFHYAGLYYRRDESSEARRRDRGGLGFPETEEPTAWDFLYFSFVLGMTAQVSDVEVRDAELRKLVLLHSIASFFFNTVLLALAVNVAISNS